LKQKQVRAKLESEYTHPRRVRLGLIEAGNGTVGTHVFGYGIRGACASASLKHLNGLTVKRISSTASEARAPRPH
tara:strand:+ start:700 stop:924 length:225 start_codon:yes stop_codon:yes gene_type:complete